MLEKVEGKKKKTLQLRRIIQSVFAAHVAEDKGNDFPCALAEVEKITFKTLERKLVREMQLRLTAHTTQRRAVFVWSGI